MNDHEDFYVFQYPALHKDDEDECACVDRSEVVCWMIRYGLESYEEVVADGGPCLCHCHDGCDDED